MRSSYLVLNNYAEMYLCGFLIFFFLGLSKADLESVLTTYDMKRLELYARNMVDYHLITDLLPAGKITTERKLKRSPCEPWMSSGG